MCGNFVLLHDWNSCETYAEPGFATPSRSASSTTTTTSSPSSTLAEKMSWLGGTPTKSPATPLQLRGKRGRALPQDASPVKYEFMHFVLEYGEKTLASCLKEVDLAQYREILWQVSAHSDDLSSFELLAGALGSLKRARARERDTIRFSTRCTWRARPFPSATTVPLLCVCVCRLYDMGG
jgi:hypothetical protein